MALGMPLSVFDGILLGCGRYDRVYQLETSLLSAERRQHF